MYQVVSFGMLLLMEIQWLNLAEMWMRGLGNLSMLHQFSMRAGHKLHQIGSQAEI